MNPSIKDNLNKKVVLTPQAVNQLCYLRKAPEVALVFMNKKFQLFKTKKEVLFKPSDLNFYIKLLQLAGVKPYHPTSAFDLGNELGYTSASENGKKDSSTASKSLSRLKRAGYIVSLQTFRTNIIFPLVRSFAEKIGEDKNGKNIYGETEHLDPASGFKKFLDESHKTDFFRSLKHERSFTDKLYGNEHFAVRGFSADAELNLSDPNKWREVKASV